MRAVTLVTSDAVEAVREFKAEEGKGDLGCAGFGSGGGSVRRGPHSTRSS